jgi:TatD DNase family protein
MQEKNEILYIDNHAHLNFRDFDVDRDESMARARSAGVGVVNVGTDKESSKWAIELAEKNENMWAIVGLHPTHTTEVFDYEYYKNLCKHPKVVGIGECGLDYFRNDESTKEYQKKVFEEHIKLSIDTGKPLMLHLRESYSDAIEILKKYPGVKGNAHFFAGTVDEAKQFLDLGITLSFTGVITFAKQYKELIEFVPLDMMISETDCPYVAPVPYRGKRNEPAYVVGVVKKIAEIKNLPVEEVSKQLLENSKRTWGIS